MGSAVRTAHWEAKTWSELGLGPQSDEESRCDEGKEAFQAARRPLIAML